MKSIMFIAVAGTLAGCGSIVDREASQPNITSIAPDHGSGEGRVTITVVGKNFQGDVPPLVAVDQRLSPTVTVVSDTELTFELPARAPDAPLIADVLIATQDGVGRKVGGFRYTVAPTVSHITPDTVRSVGGTEVTILGTGFQKDEAGDPIVTIGGVALANVQVVSDTTIKGISGADNSNPAFTRLDVKVQNANGTGTREKSARISKAGIIMVTRTDGEPSQLWHYDVDSKQVAVITNTARRITGCATRADGTMFSVTATQNTGLRRELVKVSPFDGVLTSIGELKLANDAPFKASGITFVGDLLYGLGRDAGKMVQINPMTARGTLSVGATPPLSRGRITARDAASVFLADSTTGGLVSVSLATSAVTAIAPLSGAETNSATHGMVGFGGKTYLVDRGDNGVSNLFELNTTTGALTKIQEISSPVTAMCATPNTF